MKRHVILESWIVFIVALTTCSVANALPVAELDLLTSPTNVGDTFEVQVKANGDNTNLDFLSFGFDVSFENGGIFNYTGYLLEPEFSDFSSGANNVTGMTFPGISDNVVLLATLSFTVQSIGTDTLTVKGLYDGAFSGLYYELPDFDLTGYDIDTSMTISTAAQPVPEPSALLLFSTGILGYIGMKKRN